MTNETVTPTPRGADCTCLRLRKAARLVTQIYDRHLVATGLTITQYGLLGHLRAFDGIAMGALAEKLIMDPTTLSRNLGPLVRRGLVVIEPDPRDRRARRLHLSEAGRTAFAEARPAWAEAQRQVAAALGSAEAAALHAGLDRMLERLAG